MSIEAKATIFVIGAFIVGMLLDDSNGWAARHPRVVGLAMLVAFVVVVAVVLNVAVGLFLIAAGEAGPNPYDDPNAELHFPWLR